MIPLDDASFLAFAKSRYDNPHRLADDEFEEDLNRIKYVKLLLRKYLKHGTLRDRLILNHIIILMNVFGTEAATRMLFFKIDGSLHGFLKSFILSLDRLPVHIPEVDLDSIESDKTLLSKLTTNE